MLFYWKHIKKELFRLHRCSLQQHNTVAAVAWNYLFWSITSARTRGRPRGWRWYLEDGGLCYSTWTTCHHCHCLWSPQRPHRAARTATLEEAPYVYRYVQNLKSKSGMRSKMSNKLQNDFFCLFGRIPNYPNYLQLTQLFAYSNKWTETNNLFTFTTC